MNFKTLLFYFILSIILFHSKASSDTTSKNSFGGGMFYGLGVFNIQNDYIKTTANSYVIGGRLGYNFGKKIFSGIMGNSSTLLYKKQSYIRYTYFGLVAEYKIPIHKFTISPGIWLGGGVTKNLHIENLINHQITEGYLQKHSSMFAYPYLNISYKVTKILSIHLIAEYINPEINRADIKIEGCNIRLGIMFQR